MGYRVAQLYSMNRRMKVTIFKYFVAVLCLCKTDKTQSFINYFKMILMYWVFNGSCGKVMGNNTAVYQVI